MTSRPVGQEGHCFLLVENIYYNFRKQYVHKARENRNFNFGEGKNTFEGIQISTI